MNVIFCRLCKFCVSPIQEFSRTSKRQLHELAKDRNRRRVLKAWPISTSGTNGQSHERCSNTSVKRLNHSAENSQRSSAQTTIDEEKNSERPTAQSTIDEEEIDKFEALARFWWDEGGEFQPLHAMNKLRVPLIRDALSRRHAKMGQRNMIKPLDGLKILDVGSGGGILAEPLARLGSFVIGIEASEESIKVAQTHVIQDPSVAAGVKYIKATVEDLVATEEETFDAVVASEVVEHVTDKTMFLTSCCRLVKPGGSLFMTTLNKTYLSYALGIFMAERVLRLVPSGTHDWDKFVDPQDIQYILDRNGLSTCMLHGMLFNPLTKQWSWVRDTSVNYALHAVKATIDTTETSEEEKN